MKQRTHGLAHGLGVSDVPGSEAQQRRHAAKALGALSAAVVAGWAQQRARRVLLAAGWTALTCVTVWTAIAAKEGRLGAPVLAEIGPVATERSPVLSNLIGSSSRSDGTDGVRADAAAVADAAAASGPAALSVTTEVAERETPGLEMDSAAPTLLAEGDGSPAVAPSPFDRAEPPEGWEKFAQDASVRWFNGRPVRPVREIWMTVTAYSPHEASCGDSADGITATLHHVSTNGHALVAADPDVLPYGSMITVPGYDQSRIVPVLDCGGAIKGRRLDVLFPTHEQAVRWGVRRMKVTVWEYADGAPRDNPRTLR